MEDNIYKLADPFEFGEDQVTELKLTRPNLGALRKAKIDVSVPASDDVKTVDIEFDKVLKVILVCTTEPPPKINMLSPADATEIYGKCLELFFAKTG